MPTTTHAGGSAKGHAKRNAKIKAKSKPVKKKAAHDTAGGTASAKVAGTPKATKTGSGVPWSGVPSKSAQAKAATGKVQADANAQAGQLAGRLKIDLANIPTEVEESPMNRPDGDRGDTDPKRLTKEQRKVEALNLRAQGYDYRLIAEQLGVSVNTAYHDVHEALRYLSQYERVLAEDVRGLHLTRLDLLLAGLSDRAFTGDTFAVDSYLRVMERQSRLLGLDAPTQLDVNVRRPLANATPEEMERLIQAAKTTPALNFRNKQLGPASDAEPIEVAVREDAEADDVV